MQVLPLLLITLDAWRMRHETVIAYKNQGKGGQKFVMEGVWRFIVAVNVWNIIGAGVFGSLINLPIINYFEHATYLTGHHAHAAMFGVKGNVALAGVLYCCQHLFKKSAWSEKLVKIIFWALNGGMIMMMVLDLFPVGLYQLTAVLQHGFWYARTESFTTGPVFRTFTHFRTLGGVVFLFGGVFPLIWFILSRAKKMLPEASEASAPAPGGDKEWASEPEDPDALSLD
jgi:nitric oxide reductase subunit B